MGVAMKSCCSIFSIFGISLVLGGILGSCDLLTGDQQLGEAPDTTVSISQGIYGFVYFWEGDFMPTVPPTIGGTKTPVARTIVVYTPTRIDSVEHVGYSAFYSRIMTQRVAETRSNTRGFFQLDLPVGRYSVFVVEGSLFYANGGDGLGYIWPVTVAKDSLSFVRLDITYKATF
jgi:hypothetical protein